MTAQMLFSLQKKESQSQETIKHQVFFMTQQSSSSCKNKSNFQIQTPTFFFFLDLYIYTFSLSHTIKVLNQTNCMSLYFIISFRLTFTIIYPIAECPLLFWQVHCTLTRILCITYLFDYGFVSMYVVCM